MIAHGCDCAHKVGTDKTLGQLSGLKSPIVATDKKGGFFVGTLLNLRNVTLACIVLNELRGLVVVAGFLGNGGWDAVARLWCTSC